MMHINEITRHLRVAGYFVNVHHCTPIFERQATRYMPRMVIVGKGFANQQKADKGT